MTNNGQSDLASAALKSVRLALMRLENAFNTPDPALLHRLFAEAAILITPKGRVPVFSQASIGLPALLLGEDHTPSYCTLAIDEVFLLTTLAAYAEITIRFHFFKADKLIERSDSYIVILNRDTASTAWVIVLLYLHAT